MRFTKMQGAGNDFVLVAPDDEAQCNWSKWSITICDRHFGIGADGLLLLLPSDIADFRMRTFNSDGSEAEACGNGIRCLAKYIIDKGLNNSADSISIETLGGTREVKLRRQAGKLIRIQTSMGKPEFRADYIPVTLGQDENGLVDIKSMLNYSVNIDGTDLCLNLVSMGNPHAVFFWDRPVAVFPLSELGPKVENMNIFPRRTNFEVARVINRQRIEVRTWERGVGETLACGSGACAVAVAAQLNDYIDNKADVQVTGGVLQVEWDRNNEVLLSGPVEIVFEGEWPDEV
ncbi:diaminopimelate epimerase [Chloroflexota bacterium]